MSFSMPPSCQAGFAFRNARIQTAKVGAEKNAATTTPRPSTTRLRASISGSGDDAAFSLRLYSSVEAREVLYSILVALGSGALEPVSGFAEVDFRAYSKKLVEVKIAVMKIRFDADAPRVFAAFKLYAAFKRNKRRLLERAEPVVCRFNILSV